MRKALLRAPTAIAEAPLCAEPSWAVLANALSLPASQSFLSSDQRFTAVWKPERTDSGQAREGIRGGEGGGVDPVK